jgi:hypothetical protein
MGTFIFQMYYHSSTEVLMHEDSQEGGIFFGFVLNYQVLNVGWW